MKKIFNNMLVAFSLYSIIPMPQRDWKRENMQYSLCFFPMIGIVISLLLYGWGWLCTIWAVSPVLFAVVATIIPVLVTGGIHLDGLIDTADATASHGDQEKKLAIMKDPHIGAFGVIACCSYFLLQFGLWYQLHCEPGLWLVALLGFVVSRGLNALSIATFTCAKNSGLACMFSGNAAKKTVCVCCAIYLFAACAFVWAQSVLWSIIAIGSTSLLFWRHYCFCSKGFGGNTGDLAGFLLQKTEMLWLILAVVGGL